MLDVIDRTDLMWAVNDVNWVSRSYLDIDTLIIHRNSVGRNADEVADWYAENGDAWGVGPKPPYHFLIDAQGDVEQMVELEYVANGAKGRNYHSIHVAVVGDFRIVRMNEFQEEALVSLLVPLSSYFNGLIIEPHTAPDADGKACPGGGIDIDDIIEQVMLNQELSIRELGIVL